MRSVFRQRAYWSGLVVVFVTALLPRLLEPVTRYLLWYERSVRFWDALAAHDWSGTYQQYHPGVTTMWLAGAGLRIYSVVNGVSSDELLNPPVLETGLRSYPVDAGVAVLAIFISLDILLCAWASSRLWGRRVGIVAGLLLALDPFHLARSKVLHVDAVLATTMAVSVLFWIAYVRDRRRFDLALSGVFAGLAFLTQTSSVSLIAFTSVILVHSEVWPPHEGPLETQSGGSSRILLRIAGPLLTWGLIASVTFVVLWPAMWTNPLTTLSKMVERTMFHVETAHYNPGFFAGEVVEGALSPLFYLATIAFKTTMVTLPSAVVAVIIVLLCRERPGAKTVIWVLAFISFYAVGMMLGARKEMRYLLPVFPGVAILAAYGLVHGSSWLKSSTAPAVPRHLDLWFVAGMVVMQAALVLPHHPYYGTHHNVALGGSRAAAEILPLGTQGEGMDLAAQYLNTTYPGADALTVAVQGDGYLFRRNFVGNTVAIDEPHADFRVFSIRYTQRRIGVESWGAIWEDLSATEPAWSVSFDGVPYAWVYPTYARDPSAFEIEHPVDVTLGGSIRFLGYNLNSDVVAAGHPIAVTLFWQRVAATPLDLHVFVHLMDEDSQLASQHDGIPGASKRPTWAWKEMETVVDEHGLPTDATMTPGVYSLWAGLYDFATGSRATVAGPESLVLPDGRVALGTILVVPRTGS
jgi:hypothetical protein